MTNYKNFQGTKEEYIALCKHNLVMWTKAFAESHKPAFAEALDNAEQALVNEGFTWEQVEELEIATLQSIA